MGNVDIIEDWFYMTTMSNRIVVEYEGGFVDPFEECNVGMNIVLCGKINDRTVISMFYNIKEGNVVGDFVYVDNPEKPKNLSFMLGRRLLDYALLEEVYRNEKKREKILFVQTFELERDSIKAYEFGESIPVELKKFSKFSTKPGKPYWVYDPESKKEYFLVWYNMDIGISERQRKKYYNIDYCLSQLSGVVNEYRNIFSKLP